MSPIRPRWVPALVIPVLVIAAGSAVFLGRGGTPESMVAATLSPATGAGERTGAAGAASSRNMFTGR